MGGAGHENPSRLAYLKSTLVFRDVLYFRGQKRCFKLSVYLRNDLEMTR
jgi:hypothetical protein